MGTVVVFDCESDGLPRDGDFEHVQCTVACALLFEVELHGPCSEQDDTQALLQSAKDITCWRDEASVGKGPFEALFAAFDCADLIVGYNCFQFDFLLMKKYYGRDTQRYFAHRIKTLDVFSRVRDITGLWPKLNNLLKTNGIAAKITDGATAILLWEEQRRTELRDYCLGDVQKTAELALLSSMKIGNASLPQTVYGIRSALHAASYGMTPPSSDRALLC